MLKLHSLLMILVLGISASAQAQEQDSFAAFEGKWRQSHNPRKLQARKTYHVAIKSKSKPQLCVV
ncbi:MAG: hypothetical protein L6Q37_04780 [Bdellovibrionaceae bacterium]|nr:hypothetical protein [Pseudobdellovibrionaceae bacterium]